MVDVVKAGSVRVRLLALGVVAVLIAACAGAAEPSSAAPPSTSASVAPSRTAPPSPPAANPTLTPSPRASPVPTANVLRFEQVASVEATELTAAAAVDGGFVVGGCRLRPESDRVEEGACAEARILHSPDGRTWSDAVVVGSSDRQILGFADTPLGLLAFGSNRVSEPPATRAVWRGTADAGRWEPYSIPAPAPIVFTHAFVLGDRTLLVGADTSYDFSVETEAWATTDGRAWTRGETPSTAKVAAAPGIVAIGTGCVDICPEDAPVLVQRSVDGFNWTQDAPDPALEPGDHLVAGAWAGRTILGGARPHGQASAEAAIWFDEPSGWRTATLPGGPGYPVQSLIEAEGRLIAIGYPSEEPQSRRAWWTANGRTWERLALDGLGRGYVAAWAAGEALVVVLDYASIWVSTD